MRSGMKWARVLGGVAVALAGAAAMAREIVIVNQTGDSFEPADVTIHPGDSVRWIWSSGMHTVTHGDPCTRDPSFLFDSPLDEDHPQFEFQFLSVGGVPYFCDPHCFFGMTGTVTVAPLCDGREAITSAKCRLRNGINKMTVKLTGVVADTFTVSLSTGETKSGTIGDRGTGKAKFKNLAPGPGTATARYGCGAEVTANYDCP